MPIRQFLNGEKFDSEAIRVVGVAFEMARAAIRCPGTHGVEALIAKRIIELAKVGERDPNRLCDEAIKNVEKAPEINITQWLGVDRTHIRASAARISKSADSLMKVQQRIQASAALIERATSRQGGQVGRKLPRWIATLPAKKSTAEDKSD